MSEKSFSDGLQMLKYVAGELERSDLEPLADLVRGAIVDLTPQPVPQSDKVHPMAAKETGIAPGLYRVHWIGGGTSLAAVGIRIDGCRWLAPVNWTWPTAKPRAVEWEQVESVDLLFAHPEE